MTATDTPAIAALRDPDTGELPAYAWPGGYPMIYYTADGLTICPRCANDPDKGDEPIAGDIYWEGPPIACEDAGEMMESAYGDPDAGTCDATDADECRMMRERLAAGVSNVIPGCPSGDHA